MHFSQTRHLPQRSTISHRIERVLMMSNSVWCWLLARPQMIGQSYKVALMDIWVDMTSTEYLTDIHQTSNFLNLLCVLQASDAQLVSSSANLVTLPHLKPWTLYCVMVQTRSDFYNKSSSFTSPQCMKTEGNTVYTPEVVKVSARVRTEL